MIILGKYREYECKMPMYLRSISYEWGQVRTHLKGDAGNLVTCSLILISQPTLRLHELCLKILIVHGNELRLFWTKAFPLFINGEEKMRGISNDR